MKYVLAVAAMLGILAIGSANSFATTGGDPIYMQYGTIKGDVQAQGYQQWIELSSFQFGVERPATLVGGVRELGAPTLSDLTITKAMDSSSSALMQEAFAGTPQTVTIDLVSNTGTGSLVKYASYVLTNAQVTGYSVSSGGDRPSESITIAFSKIQFTYTPLDATGIPGTPTSVTWDLATQKLS